MSEALFAEARLKNPEGRWCGRQNILLLLFAKANEQVSTEEALGSDDEVKERLGKETPAKK